MDLQTMYPAKLGSPQTILAANLAADGTSMVLNDASILPAAPNIAVIGSDENCEIISYSAINDNTVTISARGLGDSTAKAWSSGTTVARNHTSLDHNALITNVASLNTGKAEVSHTHDDCYYTKTEIDNALADKTDLDVVASEFDATTAYAIDDLVIYQGVLYRFVATHSAGAWNSAHVTASTIAQVLKTFAKFEVSGSASAGSSVTITDARINSNHWKVPKNGIWFSDSSKVTTGVHWVTNPTNHTITLEATFTGTTNVKVDLDWYQNA